MTHITVGEIDWMRNDYIMDITVGGITYPTVEHAYQAAKFTDVDVKRDIAGAETVREARRFGRSSGAFRYDWDEAKLTIMENLIRKKFQADYFGDRLAKTGTANIVMEGYDSYWGTGHDGNGENHLGQVLETIRSELQLILGINPEDYDEEDKSETPPTLKDAILNNPDDELADACQEVYDGVRQMMTLVDPNDFDAAFVSRRTGVSQTLAESAIQKLRLMQSALNSLADLLGEKKDETKALEGRSVSVLAPPSEDEYDDDDDDDDDDWLRPFD